MGNAKKEINTFQKILQRYWPVLCIFIVWIGFSYPYFFQQKVPFPSSYQVNAFSPWSRYGTYASPVKNNAMPDVIDQIYPWKHFTIEQIRQGSIPLWNPHGFAGTPHMANYQTAVFSPFTILYLFMPFIDAWSLIVLLQPLLAALFMFLYLRFVKVSQIGALIGSISFMFSGFIVVWMAYGTLAMAVAFLPLILYFIEKSYLKKSWISQSAVSIFLATSLLSGHFQMSIYITGIVLFYIVYKSYSLKNFKNGITLVFSVALGIGLAMVQILPSMEFYANAFRNKAFSTGSGIPYYNMITAVAPDFFGNPVTRNNTFLDYAEWQAFIGSIPILLLMFVVVKRKSLQLFFVLLCIGSLLLSVASPIQTLVGNLHIPVISTSVQSRTIFIFSFSVAVLAGFGYDFLQSLLKEKNHKAIIFRLSAVIVFLVVIWGIILLGNGLSADEIQIAKKNFILPTIIFIIGSISIICTLLVRKPVVFLCLAAVLVGLCAFESFRFASKWMPFDSKALMFPDAKVTTFLQKNKGDGRIFGNMGGQMEIYYGLSSVEGYDSLYIERYGEFISTDPVNRVVRLDRNSKNADRVLNLLGVTFIFHPIGDTNASWAYPVWQKAWMQPVYSDSVYRIYKNTDALPRAKMFYNFETIEQDKEIIKKFYHPTFDYKNTLLLEEKAPNQPYANVKNSVKIISYRPNAVTIAVDTEKEGMLFLSDPYYSGWKAYMDGKETKIYRADYAFRAISIPKGSHTVTFSYQPSSFILGLGLSAMSLLILFLRRLRYAR